MQLFYKILFVLLMLLPGALRAQQVDYSVVSVPEESGIDFMRITSSND